MGTLYTGSSVRAGCQNPLSVSLCHLRNRTFNGAGSKRRDKNYSIKSGQGFLLYPGQISTYIADKTNPWEYAWLKFDGLRVKEALDIAGFSKDQPIYHAVSKEYREIMMNEMLYIANHPDEPPFHLIGHSYLFWMRSSVPPPLPG